MISHPVILAMSAFYGTFGLVFALVLLKYYVAQSAQAAAQKRRDPDALAPLKTRDPGFDPDKFLGRAEDIFSRLDRGAREDDARLCALTSFGRRESRAIRGEIAARAGPPRRRTRAPKPPAIVAVESDRLFDAVHVRFEGPARAGLASALFGGRPPEFSEIWTFVRRPGCRTSDKPGLAAGLCPNCGAPVAVRDAERCASCGAWLNSGEYDWVLTQVTQSDLWSPAGKIPPDAGLELLGEADPEANLHFLEDRAQLVFWRWRLARALKDPACLRAVALEPNYPGLAESALKADSGGADPRLDALRFESFRFGDPYDQLVFRCVWSELPTAGPTRVSRRTRLELVRRKGSLTPAHSGLSSTHCPKCGAPSAGREMAQCGYCGTRFNDGFHYWVLCAVDEPPAAAGGPTPA